ncbi:MAG: hemolysin family protein, partial [Terriglobales bacterium]
ERLALAIALPMEAFIRLTSPLHGLISGAARAVLRPFGADGSLSWERAHSPDELKMLAGASVHLGHIGQPQADMIEHVLELHELAVREIMTPRHDVLALPINTPLSAALAFLASHPRSRIPVYDGSLDHLVGVLYAKDLVRWAGATRPRTPEPQHLRGLLRRLPILPESKPVDQLLREFQTGHAHMAAVVDEFGTFAGVVTVEDVLEQIVGEVRDEYDLEIEPGRPTTAGPGAMPAGEAVVLDGLTSLRDLEELHGVELPRDESYETLAGFLLFRLGDLPHGGEMVAVPPFRLTILTMAGHRVGQVRVERVAPPPDGHG